MCTDSGCCSFYRLFAQTFHGSRASLSDSSPPAPPPMAGVRTIHPGLAVLRMAAATLYVCCKGDIVFLNWVHIPVLTEP